MANLSVNLVGDITNEIRDQVGTLLPNRKLSAYIWSLESNTTKGNKEVYSVRMGAGNSVSGTNKTITLDQDFEVILSSEFKNKADNDAALDGVIYALYQDAQTVMVELYQRKLNLSRVLVVQSLELGEPSIDNDINIVNISLRFNVKYRTEI